MALQFAAALRNALLDQIETTIGTSPVLRTYTGTPPGIANAVTGTLLYEITFSDPNDWMAAASGGSKAKNGTWSDSSANNTGTPGYFTLNSSGGTRFIEGTAGVSSGDLSHDATISLGGTVTINTFTLTAGNS